MNHSQYRWGLSGLGFIWLAAVIFGVWPDTPTNEHPQIIRFMISAGVGCLIWWAAIIWHQRLSTQTDTPRNDWPALVVITLPAILARAFLLIVASDVSPLSDDVYRYMWDGRMIDSGVNPFIFAPDDSILKPLRDAYFYPDINHPYLPTIYPPLAQVFFYLSYILTPQSIAGFKIVSVIMEMGGWVAAWWYAGVAGIDRRWLIALLWCPLMVWEFCYAAHLDVLALPLLFLALVYLRKRMPLAAAVILAAAGTVKFLGWLFLPLCLWDQPWRTKLYVVLIALLTVIALYLPFWTAGLGIFGSLTDYLGEWRFNGSLYQILARMFDDPPMLRWILGGLLGLWILWGPRRWRTAEDRWLATFAGYAILTTTLFAWYLLWALPALLYRRWAPMLWLVGTVFLSYQYLVGYDVTHMWSESIWGTWVEYIGYYGLLLGSLVLWLRRRRRTEMQLVPR